MSQSPSLDGGSARPTVPIGAGVRASEATHTDAFHLVEREIAKVGRPDLGDPAWVLVVDAAQSLLDDGFKDFRVAAYLAFGWERTEGSVGLARGFELLSSFFREFWHTAHPPASKPKARAEVLRWFNERVALELSGRLRSCSPEMVQRLWEGSLAYRELARERLGADAPSFGAIDEAFAALPPELQPTADSSKEIAVDEERQHLGLLDPISAEDPAGTDPRLTDEFDRLGAEIAKVGGVATDAVDWTLVRGLSEKVMVLQAKDLRCLAYWAIARVREAGASGLFEGLSILRAFLEQFGDRLHPRRMRARVGALDWWGERLEKEAGLRPLIATPEQRAELLETLGAAEALLGDLEVASEGVGRIRGVLSTMRTKTTPSGQRKSEVEAANPGPNSRPAAPSTPVPSAPAASPPPGRLEPVAESLLEEAEGSARSGENARSLRLRRMAVWMRAPEVLDRRRRDCVGPDSQARSQLKQLETEERWDELLSSCEHQVVITPYWLDLTVWSIRAAREVLDESAVAALTGELRALITREPKLPKQLDRDGGVLARRETKAWISEELFPRSKETASTEAPASNEPSSSTVVAQNEEPLPVSIRALLDNGHVDEALRSASSWVGEVSGAAWFRRNLRLADALEACGAEQMAHPIFRMLERRSRSMTVAQWDPSLTSQCRRGYLVTKAKLRLLDPEDEELIDELVAYDPKMIASLHGVGSGTR